MNRHQQVEKRKDGHYGVIGTLGFDCVALVEKEGFAAIDQNELGIHIDFSQVEYCGSAAMALLLSWTRYGKAQGKPPVFCGFPRKLEAMVSGAGLKAILELE